jgi:hypothetical protein
MHGPMNIKKSYDATWQPFAWKNTQRDTSTGHLSDRQAKTN